MNMKDKTIEEIIIGNLIDIKEIFDKHGIEHWLDWGTLLGAIRDGKRIEWDHDVDLGVMESDFKKIDSRILSKISKRGFFIMKAPISAPELTFRRFGYGVDIWPYYSMNQDFMSTPYNSLSKKRIAHVLWLLWRILSPAYGNRDLPKNGSKLIVTSLIKCFLVAIPRKTKQSFAESIKRVLENKYFFQKIAVLPKGYFEEFRTILFHGMTFNVPFNSEEYLEHHYGKNWKVPIKEWDFKEDGAVRSAKEYDETIPVK